MKVYVNGKQVASQANIGGYWKYFLKCLLIALKKIRKIWKHKN
jgi:hypothetical protein